MAMANLSIVVLNYWLSKAGNDVIMIFRPRRRTRSPRWSPWTSWPSTSRRWFVWGKRTIDSSRIYLFRDSEMKLNWLILLFSLSLLLEYCVPVIVFSTYRGNAHCMTWKWPAAVFFISWLSWALVIQKQPKTKHTLMLSHNSSACIG